MTVIDVRTIPAIVHGRYLTRRGPEDRLLIGFHGYGESADIHLAELEQIPGIERWTVVAVQALHPFYTHRTGAVVASWMTSQDRELAIDDNVGYVRSVAEQFPKARHLVLAGFSQGVAMAYRAAAALPSSALIALGGEMPPELGVAGIELPPVLIGRGTAEDWYTDEKLQRDVRLLSNRTSVETCIYEGGHHWTSQFRSVAGRFLARIGAYALQPPGE